MYFLRKSKISHPLKEIKTFPILVIHPFKLLVEETTSCGHDPLLKSLLSRRPSRMSLYMLKYRLFFSLSRMILIFFPSLPTKLLKTKKATGNNVSSESETRKSFFCCKKIYIKERKIFHHASS